MLSSATKNPEHKEIVPTNNKKITINGITFDSKKEAARYLGLIKLQEAKRTNTKDRYMTVGYMNLFGDKLVNKYCKIYNNKFCI